MGKEARSPVETARMILESDGKDIQHKDHSSKRSSTSEKAELNPDTTAGHDGSESGSGDAKSRLEKNVSAKRSGSSEGSVKSGETGSAGDAYDGRKAIDHTFDVIRKSSAALGEEEELDEEDLLDEDLIEEEDDMGDESDDDMDDDDYEDDEDEEDVVESFKQLMDEMSGDAAYKKAMNEHIKALFKGVPSEISEEYQDKAVTIFEAAIRERANFVVEEMANHFSEKLQEQQEQLEEQFSEKYDTLVEQVDEYLGYVVEEWMKENKLAVENGLVREMYENFLSGMKQVFAENYIDIPEEKYDVLSSLQEELEAAKEEINRLLAENATLIKENKEAEKEAVIESLSEDLTLTEKNKLIDLIENIEFSNIEQFETKVKTIKESYFGNNVSDDVSEDAEDASLLTEESKPTKNVFSDSNVDSIVDIISKRGFGKR